MTIETRAYMGNKYRTENGVVYKVLDEPVGHDLDRMRFKAKKFIDANVWDGEDRAGAKADRVHLAPDDLQELVNDLIEHLHQ